MNNKKSTKKSLISSVLSLTLCMAMLIGTTFAWFTDSVTSSNNIIKSGTLDVTMEWANGKEDPATATWTDASNSPIFNNELWEPGYTEVRHIKIANEGTLALKYQLNIIANGEVSELADVIDVYYVDPAVQVADRNALTADMKLGTLTEVLAAISTTASGNLDAGEKDTITIALKMQESAGNEYQDLSIGSDFSIQLLATQLTSEFDSFDNQYDVNASYDDAILAFGGIINLNANEADAMIVAEDAKVVINMNDYALNNTLTNNGEIAVNRGTIEVADAGLDNFGTATLTDVVMNAGSAADYANRTSGADAETTYDNVTINSAGGGIGVSDGATVTFNSGSVDVNSKSTSGRYLFYVVGEDSTLTINDGNFDFNKTQNQKRAYIYAGEGATVYVNGGTFGKASTRSGYTAGILGNGKVVITGGTFGFDPSNWVDTDYKAMKNGANWIVVPKTVDAIVSDNDAFNTVIANGNDTVMLGSGTYIIPDSAQGKTLTIMGNGDTVIATQDDGSYEGCDYSLDGATVTFEGVVINTDSTTYTGYARCKGTYKNSTINGTYTLYGDSVFENCTFNVSGDVYNIWTWGAPTATFTNCTFNSDGKAMLLYGTANTKLTLNGCTFNDKGGLTDLKAAVEIGNDYGKSYELIVNSTVVNGYEINNKGINTGSTLWANKNSMSKDKLNVVIDGVDVY